jgi:hypothetical protein
MQDSKGSGVFDAWAVALALGLALGSPAGRAAPLAADIAHADRAPTGIVTGTWQHHKASFSYFGVATLYTCDGLEGQVGNILRHLGARRDVHVSARGCPGPDTPSHTAWVEADFYTLVPVAGAAGPGTVDARWTPVEVTTRHPYFMGTGDCELIQEMKDFITQNFSLRDVEYRAECDPRQYTQDAFSIKGQALTLLPAQSHAAIIGPLTGQPMTGRPVTGPPVTG